MSVLLACQWLQVFLTETAHTLGLCLFVFRVLPMFDAVRAVLLMCCSNIFPAVLKLIMTKGGRKPLAIIMDIIAVGMQGSVFFFVTLYNSRNGRPTRDLIEMVEIVSSLFLISVRYWENFIDRDICSISMQRIKQSLRLGRCKTYIFASLWKMALTIALAYLLVPNLTPMPDIFLHIGNETAFDNKTSAHNAKSKLDSDFYYDSQSNEYDAKDTHPQYEQFNHPREAASLILDKVSFPPTSPSLKSFETQILRPEVPQTTGSSGTFLRSFHHSRVKRQADTNHGTTRVTSTTTIQPTITNPHSTTAARQMERTIDISNRISESKSKDNKSTKTGTSSEAGVIGNDNYQYDDYYQVPNHYDSQGDSTQSTSRGKIDKVLYRFLPFIVHAISGAVCYFFSRIACKLCMQGFSYSLPLTLITPGRIYM